FRYAPLHKERFKNSKLYLGLKIKCKFETGLRIKKCKLNSGRDNNYLGYLRTDYKSALAGYLGYLRTDYKSALAGYLRTDYKSALAGSGIEILSAVKPGKMKGLSGVLMFNWC
ncbi:MAG: hypothetical protein U9R32_01350, partial [Bacteroidota bacterium]|nr:hypothetical protein [Bacteroidota bacterium]